MILWIGKYIGIYNYACEGPRLQVPLENNTFQDNASKLFNNLPISIRNCNNFSIFSKLVKQYLANRDI